MSQRFSASECHRAFSLATPPPGLEPGTVSLTGSSTTNCATAERKISLEDALHRLLPQTLKRDPRAIRGDGKGLGRRVAMVELKRPQTAVVAADHAGAASLFDQDALDCLPATLQAIVSASAADWLASIPALRRWNRRPMHGAVDDRGCQVEAVGIEPTCTNYPFDALSERGDTPR